MTSLDIDRVKAVLAPHAKMYESRPPVYQTVMLDDLAQLWQRNHARLLDIGGGTGVIAQAIQELLPADVVTSVDVVDRYFPTLSVETRVYDGERLPFDDASFDAATINNVMHHIPREIRPGILKEIRRVVDGPLYIKDHVAGTWLDHRRLTVLDAIGNLPFGGQIEAWYLSSDDWQSLAREGGYKIVETRTGPYRSGLMAMAFPNRLEIAMRLEPV